jgi:hypothetical protein
MENDLRDSYKTISNTNGTVEGIGESNGEIESNNNSINVMTTDDYSDLLGQI